LALGEGEDGGPGLEPLDPSATPVGPARPGGLIPPGRTPPGSPARTGGWLLEQRSVNGMSPELREEVACKRREPLSEIERRSTEEKQRHKIGSCIQLSGGIE
ncbi:hypothetical protein THAOC_19773, partial [Thalassiosira oceanica]